MPPENHTYRSIAELLAEEATTRRDSGNPEFLHPLEEISQTAFRLVQREGPKVFGPEKKGETRKLTDDEAVKLLVSVSREVSGGVGVKFGRLLHNGFTSDAFEATINHLKTKD